MSNVRWSNSHYTMDNDNYDAPSIQYQFDIENSTTDKIRFMWESDSTASQIISQAETGDMPGVPAILLSCLRISELTP
jgi:hypothetical protein